MNGSERKGLQIPVTVDGAQRKEIAVLLTCCSISGLVGSIPCDTSKPFRGAKSFLSTASAERFCQVVRNSRGSRICAHLGIWVDWGD